MKPKKYFTLNEFKLCGIYFLFECGKLVYIGQSMDIYVRVSQHSNSGKAFDTVRFIACEPDKMSFYETRWIKRFKPCLNSNMGGSRKTIPIPKITADERLAAGFKKMAERQGFSL